MAASAISSLLQVLNPLIQNEVGLLWGVDKDMRRLSSTFFAVLAVLDDAELRQPQPIALQDWLRKLKDAAHDAREILEDFKTEASRWESEGQSCASLRKVWTCYPVQILFFRHNIGNRMKDVIENINAIAEERTKFHLTERIPENLNEYLRKRETGAAPPEEVFGREDDKNHILKVLTVDRCDVQQVSVYPIIGMGGLGKTTLAQMVVNDEKIKRHFEPTVWVHVSQDFNVKTVMKLIIESVSKKKCEESSLDSLQKHVREMLSGKRYLLVLDDVWNEDEDEWDKLKNALSSESPGACVLVTTRSKKVASTMRALPTDHLSTLSEDDCWLLFRQRAFGPDNEERPQLVVIGKEIVKKCGGAPLAAKALGGLMRTKKEVKQWENIKESNMWDLGVAEVSIWPALRLSYYDLPREMRHCFTYCVVFPKGSRMEKDNIIQLWMANGFIPSSDELQVEDVGENVWNELYKRSLFLRDEKNPEDMFMHDLVYDLARSIIEDECCTMEAESSSTIPEGKIRHGTLRHVTLITNGGRANDIPEALRGQQRLHSILLPKRGQYIHDEFSCDFKDLGSLRVFDASGLYMKQLSKSIGNLRHLTHLNLSRTPITELPKSICSLYHLQTINLNYYENLQRLPKKIHRLTSLRHLCLRGCERIEDTPPKLGKLSQLKTLCLFIVGESDGQRVGELQHLNLGGELSIRNLERVRNSKEAKEANVAGKHNLATLSLEWGSHIYGSDLREVIEALQPHPNIQELTIRYYKGEELPVWMGDPSVLRNVVCINIYGCSNCLGLPDLWNLPCLKRLVVGGMDKMEYMFNNKKLSGGGGGSVTSVRAFSSLEELQISWNTNLKGWLLSMEEGEEGIVVEQQLLLFPRLRKMNIFKCPRLVALFPALPALEELVINFSSSVTLLGSISKLTALTSLRLIVNREMVSIPDEMLQNLTLLQSLKISSFNALKVLPENMSSLVSLKKLEITSCYELECLPDGGIGSLKSLLELTVYECRKIASLPDSIQTLTLLQTLNIRYCSPELKRRCEKDKGQDWYKIAHIPSVRIV